ncbi:hypothetical protein KRX57_01145 [Weeksellaceae bacterium TAE3-ERU29]|nr:hypothetical protein [Weeksellaceae bacterium TAE3-ERU29]
MHYRAGANYNYTSGDDTNLNLGLKVGIDKTFLQSNNWFFYYGMDIGGSYNFYKRTEKHIGDVFIAPFLGIMYKFNKNFSVSTEPNIYYKTNFIIDNGTFETDNKKVWGQSGLGKIGYLQLNFHF